MKSHQPLSKRTSLLVDCLSPLVRFFSESAWATRFGEPGISDFTIGNPHDLPLRPFVDALQRWSTPQDVYWYSYKRNEPKAREFVAQSLRKSHDLLFDPEDIFMTNGATAALMVVLAALVSPGDEVVFISPPWFLYECMILNAGGVPVRIKAGPPEFELDPDAVARAITGRTKAVIINSPHNPTGRIYAPDTLKALSGVLGEASTRFGQTIYLISDEAYRRILFDGAHYHSPLGSYPNSFLVYTYGKALLAPGQRIGYIALHPDMPERKQLADAIPTLQMINGWSFPNALLQHAIEDLEKISVDLDRLQAKRDKLVGALRQIGYTTNMPQATFYILARSPIPNDQMFVEILAKHDIFCVPGSLMGLPGYFRLSLTASDEMIERALPGFKAALSEAMTLAPQAALSKQGS